VKAAGRLGLALLTASIVGGLAGCAAPRPAPIAGDGRRVVVLAPAERDMVLAEMRQMLESLNEVLYGLAAQDAGRIERAARAAGLGMAAGVEAQVVRALPPLYRELAMQTHRGFDLLAASAAAGQPREDLIRALSGIMSDCVACHSAYRAEAPR
jgi:hypothetical protein